MRKPTSFVITFVFGLLATLLIHDTSQSVEASPAKSTRLLGRPLKIAVVDTGIDQSHPYIKDLLWANPGESGLDHNGRPRATNGLDDDANGFVDDVHGWNFVDNSNDLTDNSGHGTHISGIIKQAISQDYGFDVQPQVQLITLKYYDPEADNSKSVNSFTKSIHYAIEQKVDIINISGGGPYFNNQEFDVLRKAQKAGIIVVAASGNKAHHEGFYPFYPAYYQLNNIISVTATSPQGELLKTSNFDPENVDVAAPGQRVYSSLPGNRFGHQTGTSQATAFVTGTVSWILSSGLHKSAEEIKDLIVASGTKTEFLEDKSLSSVRLNAKQALARIQSAWTEHLAMTDERAREPASSPSEVK